MMKAAPTSHRWLLFLGGAGVALLYLGGISEITFVDIDLWHEMALFREARHLGWVPFADQFAYTPTVAPSVHHEWGTGAVAYLLAVTFGSPGLMVFKYVLTALIAAMCYLCARRQGASTEGFLTLAPLVLTPACIGFTTIRAQVFTLCFLAFFFLCLQEDREGRRRWLYFWLPAYLLWLNLHGGFVVGLVLLALHILEQALRRQPIKNAVTAAVFMALLIFVNPYGWYYPIYLWHALQVDRSMITEWQPLWWNWPANWSTIAIVAVAIGLILYASSVRGLRHVPGLLLVLACAYAGTKHYRHLSIFAVAWLCFAPAYVEGTGLSALIHRIWRQQPAFLACFWIAVGIFGAVHAVQNRFWELRVPFRETPHYPVGAVAYLEEQHFRGNVVVPFEMGAFVSWKLYPSVRVSIDSRMEVAYPPGVLAENLTFFNGQPGWREFLTRYPADVVLLYHDKPVVPLLTAEKNWPIVYEDDFFIIFARSGLGLPKVDRRGMDWEGSFP